MQEDTRYCFRVTVEDDVQRPCAALEIAYDHRDNALRLFDDIVRHISTNFDAVRRAALEAACSTDPQPLS